ncbi:MAG: nucleotide exchange factor GrpE [Acidobacteria bacterium]|nr:nucleotide exchange factor GrpE [Acidobacteriota bacterium]
MSEPQDPINTAGAATDGTGESPADAIQKERDELFDRLLRKTAEFDNFRKRVERERKDFTEWAAADVLTDLLAVTDDFERALAADAPSSAQAYKTGVEIIHRALLDLLGKRGVTPIAAIGADFDPHIHQAVAYDAVDGAREGEVVEELRKGYMLGERLLRPSLVKVAKAS